MSRHIKQDTNLAFPNVFYYVRYATWQAQAVRVSCARGASPPACLLSARAGARGSRYRRARAIRQSGARGKKHTVLDMSRKPVCLPVSFRLNSVHIPLNNGSAYGLLYY